MCSSTPGGRGEAFRIVSGSPGSPLPRRHVAPPPPCKSKRPYQTSADLGDQSFFFNAFTAYHQRSQDNERENTGFYTQLGTFESYRPRFGNTFTPS